MISSVKGKHKAMYRDIGGRFGGGTPDEVVGKGPSTNVRLRLTAEETMEPAATKLGSKRPGSKNTSQRARVGVGRACGPAPAQVGGRLERQAWPVGPARRRRPTKLCYHTTIAFLKTTLPCTIAQYKPQGLRENPGPRAKHANLLYATLQ